MLDEEAAEVKETASQGTEPPRAASPFAGLDLLDASNRQRPLGEQAHALLAARPNRLHQQVLHMLCMVSRQQVVWLTGDMVNARLNEEWSAANAPRELQQQPADSVAFLFSMLQPEVMAKIEPLAKINLAMAPLFLSRSGMM